MRHEDYLPDEYRPAFSSHPIELNLHRIKGLSERFVYFNDDMYLLRPVGENLLSVRRLIADDLVHNVIKLVRIIKISHDISTQICGIGGSITVGNADCH